MAAPEIIIDAPAYQVNVTLLLAVITVSLAAMGTLIKIFAKEKNPENEPGKNPYCKQSKEESARLDANLKENNKKHEELKQIVNDLKSEVGILKNQSENIVKTTEEMKQYNREIASKLDVLLKQLMDWMSQ